MKYYADVENAEIHEIKDESAAIADDIDKTYICDTRFEAKLLCLDYAQKAIGKAKDLKYKARQL